MKMKRGLMILLFCFALVSSLGVVSSYQYSDCYNTWDDYNEYSPDFGEDSYTVVEIGNLYTVYTETECLANCEQIPYVSYCAYSESGNGKCYAILSKTASYVETYSYDNVAGKDANYDGFYEELDSNYIDEFTSCGISSSAKTGFNLLDGENKECVPKSDKNCEDITAGETSCLQKACGYKSPIINFAGGECTGTNVVDCLSKAQELNNYLRRYNDVPTVCGLIDGCKIGCEKIPCEYFTNPNVCNSLVSGCTWNQGEFAEENTCIGNLKIYCSHLDESECSSSSLCKVSCQEDYAQCEGGSDSACEYLKDTFDTKYCGSCNNPCYSPFVCVDGSCESPCSNSEEFTYRQCHDGAPYSESTSDYSCCSSTSDCVYSGNCYSSGDTLDMDSDGDNEICQDSEWYECKSDSQCGENEFCNDENSDYRCYEKGTCSGSSTQECNTLNFNNCLAASGPSYSDCCNSENACSMNDAGVCVTTNCEALITSNDCDSSGCIWTQGGIEPSGELELFWTKEKNYNNIKITSLKIIKKDVPVKLYLQDLNLQTSGSCEAGEDLEISCSSCNFQTGAVIECCNTMNSCEYKSGSCVTKCNNQIEEGDCKKVSGCEWIPDKKEFRVERKKDCFLGLCSWEQVSTIEGEILPGSSVADYIINSVVMGDNKAKFKFYVTDSSGTEQESPELVVVTEESPCIVDSVSWESNTGVAGNNINLIIKGNDANLCEGVSFSASIYEKDENEEDDFVETIQGSFDGNSATLSWNVQSPGIDDIAPQAYYFTAGGETSGLLEVQDEDVACAGITYCSDHETEETCNSNQCNEGKKSIEENNPSIICNGIDIICSCVWNKTSEKCGPTYTINDENGNALGTCVMDEDTSDSCEDDGKLTYSWSAVWNWAQGATEDLSNENYLACQSGENTHICPAQVELPFFNWISLVSTIAIVGIVYILLKKDKNKNIKIKKK